MKVQIKKVFTMRGGKQSIVGEKIDVDDKYAKYLVKNGYAECLSDAKASNTTNTTSKRARKPGRSKKTAKDSIISDD